MSDWYDRTGRKVSMEELGDLLRIPDYKRVAYTEVASATDKLAKYRVSTVWLGLDHNWGDGDPLIFETMVFADGPDPWADKLCRRYTNELDAKLGHEETVILVAATVPDEVIAHL
jgi:hypothetical protein